MAHTILLVQPGVKIDTRTYTDYESVNECMEVPCVAALRIRIRIRSIQMFLGFPDLHPDPSRDPDPSIMK
jgi:hypothetical protein